MLLKRLTEPEVPLLAMLPEAAKTIPRRVHAIDRSDLEDQQTNEGTEVVYLGSYGAGTWS